MQGRTIYGGDTFTDSRATRINRVFALLAVGLWCVSLALPGLHSFGQQQSGLLILAIGWLAVVSGNLAWLANGFFLYSASRLIAGKRAAGSAFFASILSLDTFRLTETLSAKGEMGTTIPIYGYGWGAVLWFGAVYVLFVTAVFREPNVSRSGRAMGVLPALVLAAFFAFWSINDRIEANAAEKARLGTAVAFKRGEVCDASDPSVSLPIGQFSGVLEIQGEARVFPFAEPRNLLDWGIPVVRVGDVDYSKSADGAVAAREAEGRPSAALWITSAVGGSGGYRVKLTESDSGRVVFDQTWVRKPLGGKPGPFCPAYSPFPRSGEQPRQLLMDALGYPKPKANSGSRSHE